MTAYFGVFVQLRLWCVSIDGVLTLLLWYLYPDTALAYFCNWTHFHLKFFRDTVPVNAVHLFVRFGFYHTHTPHHCFLVLTTKPYHKNIVKNNQFITQCKDDIEVTPLKKQTQIYCLTQCCAKVQICPYRTSCSTCWSFVVGLRVMCAKLELQVRKVGRFSVV